MARTHHRILATAILATALTACAPGVPTTATGLAGTLTTRTVDIVVANGASVSGAPASPGSDGGGIVIGYDSSSKVVSARGSLGVEPIGAVPGLLRLDVSATPIGMSGLVSVELAGTTTSATGVLSSFTADDHGDVSGVLAVGATSISFATHSSALAPGTDPVVESLLAEEEDFCADAQQRLAGLDPGEVPIASIVNTHESPRSAFAASKSTLQPLTTRTWTDTVDISRGGDHRTISRHVSCKTRSADHLATTGVATSTVDTQCAALNQRSIDLATAAMTAGELAGATLPTLGSDVVRQTGVEWTTPLADSAEYDGTTLRAHALLVRWTDPAFALAPDTIRGVHYCTVWSPVYAYSVLTGSAAPGGGS